MTRGWANSAQPSEKWFLSFSVWSEIRQILVQFLLYSDIECHKSKKWKGCPKKNSEHNFWYRGKKSKVQSWSNWSEIFRRYVGSIYKTFLPSGPYWFRPLFPKYGLFKDFLIFDFSILLGHPWKFLQFKWLKLCNFIVHTDYIWKFSQKILKAC